MLIICLCILVLLLQVCIYSRKEPLKKGSAPNGSVVEMTSVVPLEVISLGSWHIDVLKRYQPFHEGTQEDLESTRLPQGKKNIYQAK